MSGSKPNTPGVTLTVMETTHFLMSNWMPPDVLADMAFERPDMLKSFDLPPRHPRPELSHEKTGTKTGTKGVRLSRKLLASVTICSLDSTLSR